RQPAAGARRADNADPSDPCRDHEHCPLRCSAFPSLEVVSERSHPLQTHQPCPSLTPLTTWSYLQQPTVVMVLVKYTAASREHETDTQKPPPDAPRAVMWRWRRDLNPRRVAPYPLSRRAPSATRRLHREELYRILRRAKNRERRATHSAATSSSTRSGGNTSGRWFCRGSRSASQTEPAAPAFVSRAP